MFLFNVFMKRNTQLTFRFFWGYFKKYRWLIVGLTFFLALGVVANLAWVMIFRQFFEALSLDESSEVVLPMLYSILGWVILVEVVDVVSWRVAAHLNIRFQVRSMADITEDCYAYLQGHSSRFFSNNFAGALVKKVNKITRGFEEIVDSVSWDMFPLALKVIFISGILFWVNLWIGVAVLIWAVVFLAANYYVALYKWKFDLASSQADTRITAVLSDAITNASNVKLFAASSYERQRLSRDTKNWKFKTQKAWDLNNVVELFQAVLMVLLEVAMLYLAIRLWEQDLIVIGDFFVIQAYLFELFHQLWDFGRNLRQIFESLADSEEMTVVMNTKHEVRDKRGAKSLVVRRGDVKFKNVSFAYGKGGDILSGLNLHLKPGEKVALIGPSGGGKSTIVKLLLRLFDVSGGSVLIDGQDIAGVKQESLRSQVVLVPQDPILFHRTLIENIRYGRRDASDEEVKIAAKLAHCEEFINGLPDGYQTYVGERGVKLSGGQRQRIAIARAILSDAKILVFDEATSSLDSESEALIQDAILNMTKRKTTLIIAHRLSTIMTCDRIYVLNGGSVVEEGSHNELMKLEEGLYKKLWDLQVGGYI